MLISDLSSEQLLLLIVPVLPNMWALRHAMYHDFPTPKEKYRWMMACVFLPCVAGIAYFFVGKKHASKEKTVYPSAYQQSDNAAEPSVLLHSKELPHETDTTELVQRQEHIEVTSQKTSGDWSFGCPDDIKKS
jgi:hypothetical protein